MFGKLSVPCRNLCPSMLSALFLLHFLTLFSSVLTSLSKRLSLADSCLVNMLMKEFIFSNSYLDHFIRCITTFSLHSFYVQRYHAIEKFSWLLGRSKQRIRQESTIANNLFPVVSPQQMKKKNEKRFNQSVSGYISWLGVLPCKQAFIYFKQLYRWRFLAILKIVLVGA